MDDYFSELRGWLIQTRDEPLETMDGFFDARIDSYEEHMSRWSEHYIKIAELLPETAESLIDFGCGSGLELDRIFERFTTLSVTGVDMSEKMLEKLKKKHGDKDLVLIRGDYFKYDPGISRYDAAVAFETLHHVNEERKTALFKKIYGCLKAGGIYLECDYIAVSEEIETLLFSECDRRRKRDGIQDNVFVHFDTPLTLEHELRALRNGGFTDISVVGFFNGDEHTPIIKAIK